MLFAHTIFGQSNVYLAAAFPISSHQSIEPTTALLAFAGGVSAAVLVSLAPLLVLRSGSPTSAARGTEHSVQHLSRRAARSLGLLGASLVAGVTVLVLADPALTILGGVLLALAIPCLIPVSFDAVLLAVKWLGRRRRDSTISLAAIELNATATRSIALIAVAALAVYGSVAIQGARADLTRGLDEAVVESWIRRRSGSPRTTSS